MPTARKLCSPTLPRRRILSALHVKQRWARHRACASTQPSSLVKAISAECQAGLLPPQTNRSTGFHLSQRWHRSASPDNPPPEPQPYSRRSVSARHSLPPCRVQQSLVRRMKFFLHPPLTPPHTQSRPRHCLRIILTTL